LYVIFAWIRADKKQKHAHAACFVFLGIWDPSLVLRISDCHQIKDLGHLLTWRVPFLSFCSLCGCAANCLKLIQLNL
jgi:hypothetical protein